MGLISFPSSNGGGDPPSYSFGYATRAMRAKISSPAQPNKKEEILNIHKALYIHTQLRVECPILCWVVSIIPRVHSTCTNRRWKKKKNFDLSGLCTRIFRPNRIWDMPTIYRRRCVGPSFVRPLIRINYSISRNRIIGVYRYTIDVLSPHSHKSQLCVFANIITAKSHFRLYLHIDMPGEQWRRWWPPEVFFPGFRFFC